MSITLPEAAKYRWASLLSCGGAKLEGHHITLLDALGKGSGLIPVIFRKAQNRIQDPANLRRGFYRFIKPCVLMR